jgi:hypothetical protein
MPEARQNMADMANQHQDSGHLPQLKRKADPGMAEEVASQKDKRRSPEEPTSLTLSSFLQKDP